MRILQVAPLWERVPPPAYGGTEAVVSVLTDALVKLGHEVVLRASGDSLTLAELRYVYPRSLRTDDGIANGTPYDWVHAAEAIADAADFDIVHNHAGEPVMALAGLLPPPVPMLTTMHCLTTPDTRFVWDQYRGYYNTISRAQLASVPPLSRPRHAGVVYNGIDVAAFPYKDKKEDFLLCLSRISPEKGIHLAIEVARRAGRKLVIAGKVDPADQHYYETTVKPLVDGRRVEFLGEADYRLKRELYAKASVALMPICWEEPFGLVMIEAMACGTPVIAFARGAAPEIVLDGETGFLVHDTDGMLSALERVDGIRPARCRRHVEENFDAAVMVGGYLRMYNEILGSRAALDAAPPPPPTLEPTYRAGEIAGSATV